MSEKAAGSNDVNSFDSKIVTEEELLSFLDDGEVSSTVSQWQAASAQTSSSYCENRQVTVPLRLITQKKLNPLH